MKVVLDTSVVIAVLTNAPGKAGLIDATRHVELIAPMSLHVEVGNAFSAMFKRRRITLEQARRAVAAYRAIPIQQVEIDLVRALELAHALDIYGYDAYMIDCAQRYKAALLTLDGGLKEAARRAGIALLEE